MELRLERERVQLRLAGERLAPGVEAELVLDLPAEAADLSGGAARFQSRLCDLDRLELALSPAAVTAALQVVTVRAALRAGFLELAGTIEEGDGVPFTAKLAPLRPSGAGLRLAVYEPRLYGVAPLPAPALATRLAASLALHLAVAGGQAAGPVIEAEPLRPALLAILPRRGWKLPRSIGVQATRAELGPAGARLVWSRWDPPDAEIGDPDLRAFLHGAPAFAGPEALLAAGDLDGAREAWRALPPGARTHPFAAGRALGFLAAHPALHAEAQALARAALDRDDGFAPALAAQALIALARGDRARASHGWSDLTLVAARRGEVFSALAAADACAACGDDADPGALTAALDTALTLDRSHLPALRARRELAARGGDRAELLRACRGLAAYAPVPEEKARAHLALAELLAATDPVASRLHRENARRLAGGSRSQAIRPA